MKFEEIIKVVLRGSKFGLLVGLILAGAVFYFTMGEPKVYKSTGVVYTGIASGHTIEGKNKADFYVTSNAFDNLLSIIENRETRQKVILRLLAEHLLLEEPDPLVLNYNSFLHLQELFDQERRKHYVVPGSYEQTLKNIEDSLKLQEVGHIYAIINSDDPHYSMKSLSKVTAYRVKSSDLIQVEFESDDPAICQRTLKLLLDVFIEINRDLKFSQSHDVVAYFERKLKESQSHLSRSEDNFLEFNKRYNIINYYEQTKHISSEKENLEKDITEMKMVFHGAQAALEKVESKLGSKALIELYSDKLIFMKEDLSKITTELVFMELNETVDVVRADSLRSVQKSIVDNLSTNVDGLFLSQHSTEGLPINDLLTRWIESTLSLIHI